MPDVSRETSKCGYCTRVELWTAPGQEAHIKLAHVEISTMVEAATDNAAKWFACTLQGTGKFYAAAIINGKEFVIRPLISVKDNA